MYRTKATSNKSHPELLGIADLPRYFKVLGDETRLGILRLLADGELCVCEVVERTGLSQPLVSHHLRVLKQYGLVRDRKEGRWMHYSLNPQKFDELNGAYLRFFAVERISTQPQEGSREQCAQ